MQTDSLPLFFVSESVNMILYIVTISIEIANLYSATTLDFYNCLPFVFLSDLLYPIMISVLRDSWIYNTIVLCTHPDNRRKKTYTPWRCMSRHHTSQIYQKISDTTFILILTIFSMTTNNNSTSGNDTNPKKSGAQMNDTDTNQPKAGDQTRQPGDLPTDPQSKSGDDNNKNQRY